MKKKKKTTKPKQLCPHSLIHRLLFMTPFYIMLYSHTVNDLAAQRTITNYDPRRRLRTTLSGGPTKLSAAQHNNTNSNHSLNGYVLADSSSSCSHTQVTPITNDRMHWTETETETEIEIEVELKLNWSWIEVKLKLIYNWIDITLNWNWIDWHCITSKFLKNESQKTQKAKHVCCWAIKRQNLL